MGKRILSGAAVTVLAVVAIAIIAPILLVFGGVVVLALPFVDVIIFALIVRAIIKLIRKKRCKQNI